MVKKLATQISARGRVTGTLSNLYSYEKILTLYFLTRKVSCDDTVQGIKIHGVFVDDSVLVHTPNNPLYRETVLTLGRGRSAAVFYTLDHIMYSSK